MYNICINVFALLAICILKLDEKNRYNCLQLLLPYCVVTLQRLTKVEKLLTPQLYIFPYCWRLTTTYDLNNLLNTTRNAYLINI